MTQAIQATTVRAPRRLAGAILLAALAGAPLAGCTTAQPTLGEQLTDRADQAQADARVARRAERDIRRGEALVRGGERDAARGRELIREAEERLRRLRLQGQV